MKRQQSAKYIAQAQKALKFNDIATAVAYGSYPADQRVQVKMPSEVVTELNAQFPGINRSQLLTQLAVNAIQNKLRFADTPDLGAVAQDDQTDLDDMLTYLEKRDIE